MTRRFVRSTFFVMAGLLIWAADFLFTYVFTAAAIARGLADWRVLGVSIVTFAVTVATLVALVATLAIGVSGYRAAQRESGSDVDRFLFYLAVGVAALGGIAIVWNAMAGWVL